jgi:FlaA1/EpsC-like NDP-sugar epimerase
VAVIGSRDAGAAAVRDMLNNPRAGLVPVAVFDDDCAAHGLSLLGVPVMGPIHAIAGAKGSCGIEQVVLAIPSPSTDLIHRSLLAAEAAGVPMKLLPGMRDLAVGRPIPPRRHPRPFRIEDLLGRPQVTTDLDAVGHSLASGRVLITGAGGSIGSEIARQVARFEPELVILLDRDETHLHDAAWSLSGNFVQELIDIRDPDAVFEVMARLRPSVVFHAAAHKHVPILEAHPIEATKTNVFGTLNMVEASAALEVPRFIMISTDKAVRPTSVMGATKLIGERLLLAQDRTETTFCAVRFGNVLGSRGSVIPTFSRQIAVGGPVTVTDPLMTRYFMSVEEAVQLVLQASLLATGGDVFMLDMGEPVSILDLAKRMIRLSGYGVGTEIDIEFVGGRPGERLSEELCSPDEERTPTSHPSIVSLAPPTLHHDVIEKGLLQLHEAVALRESERVRDVLFALAGSVPHLVAT